MASKPGTTDNTSLEWPTIALVAGLYAAWLILTWFHDAIPVWLWLPVSAWVSAWWGSAQHEMLHGHPTRVAALNTALATPPFWLYLPFDRYRQSHLTHHRDECLTDPLDDPESRYWTQVDWQALGTIRRALVRAQGTLAGRITIGPIWVMASFLWNEAKAIASGDRERARIAAWHALWVSLTLVWIVAVCGVPLWMYFLGFAYGGTALTLIRSFAEHRAHTDPAQRTAIVENSRIFGLLFLHNNLHAAHHRWPSVAWYRLPRVYRDKRAALIADNGALVYDGYRDLFARYFLRRHDAEVHPIARSSG
jgi:fatty acid desaturase